MNAGRHGLKLRIFSSFKFCTMAKQLGIVKLEGTLGDITFLKTRDGYLAKEKTHISADRIANDPAFKRTRENGAEFGRSGKAGKLLRTAFRASIQTASDSKAVGRLVKTLMSVIKADTTSDRGLRNVMQGNQNLLMGFEFNVNAKLSTTLYTPYTINMDRVTGVMSVDLASFVPANMIAAPGGTTHFKLRAEAAAVDFAQESSVSALAETALLPWNQTATGVINLQNALPANSTAPIILVLGIEFSQEVNGNQYPLNNGAYNALGIVAVDAV